jgi:septum formation inhibitor MinC
MEQTTPGYISALVKPLPGRGSDRRAWSIPLAGVWLPFFTATNTAGETAIEAEALGAPLRLQYEKDGTPKFSQNGKPVIRIVKELADQIRIVRENFMAGLLSYAQTVQKAMPDEFKAQVEAAQKAGLAITTNDSAALTAYFEALKARAEADQAEAKAEPPKAAPKKRERKAKPSPAVEQAIADAEAKAQAPAPTPEPVTA